jgi:hypothetical protein
MIQKGFSISFLNFRSQHPKHTCLVLLLLLAQYFVAAQKRFFHESFESKTLDTHWQSISGNWQITSVQDMRIAPAENGNEFVLSSGEPGLIRLIVDIPDSLKAKKLRLQFAYYTYSKGTEASLEIEFHKREQKDGSKGKLIKTTLPLKGRWSTFKKDLTIPPGANSLYLVFEANKKNASVSKKVCFDVINISALK